MTRTVVVHMSDPTTHALLGVIIGQLIGLVLLLTLWRKR